MIADLNNQTQMDIAIANSGDFNQVFNYQRTFITANGSRPKGFITSDLNSDKLWKRRSRNSLHFIRFIYIFSVVRRSLISTSEDQMQNGLTYDSSSTS